MTHKLSCALRNSPLISQKSSHHASIGHLPPYRLARSLYSPPSYNHLRQSVRFNSSDPVTRVTHNTRVNGPATTLPPPLVINERGPQESLISFAFKRGKSYLTFYKTGLRHLVTNFQASRKVWASVKESGRTSESSSAGSKWELLYRAVVARRITRSEFQLLYRTRHDISRVPAFALLFLICGEFTPLVVIYVSQIVPWTCRIPAQVRKEREALESRRRASFRNLVVPSPETAREADVQVLRRPQLLHIGRSLGLFSPWWPEALSLPPDRLLRFKIGARVKYLEVDDRAIANDGGVNEMEMEEGFVESVAQIKVDSSCDFTFADTAFSLAPETPMKVSFELSINSNGTE
ncbi:MAG: hypothetical protein M1819_006931 [Sarea resinae]|nr:MAG: hypothetical protein M1819_006931 [Sarea resinae]